MNIERAKEEIKKYKLGYEKPSVDDIQGWIDAANK